MSAGSITLDHVVFEVEDPERSADFYRGLLGWEEVRLAEYRKGEAPFLSSRVSQGTILDFFPPKMWRKRRRSQNPHHVCFTLSRLEVRNLRRRLARRNIPIVRESRRNFGARGWGVSLYIEDPDGISVEFRYYPDKSGTAG